MNAGSVFNINTVHTFCCRIHCNLSGKIHCVPYLMVHTRRVICPFKTRILHPGSIICAVFDSSFYTMREMVIMSTKF